MTNRWTGANMTSVILTLKRCPRQILRVGTMQKNRFSSINLQIFKALNLFFFNYLKSFSKTILSIYFDTLWIFNCGKPYFDSIYSNFQTNCFIVLLFSSGYRRHLLTFWVITCFLWSLWHSSCCDVINAYHVDPGEIGQLGPRWQTQKLLIFAKLEELEVWNYFNRKSN